MGMLILCETSVYPNVGMCTPNSVRWVTYLNTVGPEVFHSRILSFPPAAQSGPTPAAAPLQIAHHPHFS